MTIVKRFNGDIKHTEPLFCQSSDLKNDFLTLSLKLQRKVVGIEAQACWVRFPLEEMKYFIFLFLGSGVKGKSRFEFRHSTLNASRIQR